VLIAASDRGCRENHSFARCINGVWDATMAGGARGRSKWDRGVRRPLKCALQSHGSPDGRFGRLYPTASSTSNSGLASHAAALDEKC
jgi:hypothetical protein